MPTPGVLPALGLEGGRLPPLHPPPDVQQAQRPELRVTGPQKEGPSACCRARSGSRQVRPVLLQPQAAVCLRVHVELSMTRLFEGFRAYNRCTFRNKLFLSYNKHPRATSCPLEAWESPGDGHPSCGRDPSPVRAHGVYRSHGKSSCLVPLDPHKSPAVAGSV